MTPPADRLLSRRAMLRSTLHGSSLIAMAPTVPGFLARTARAATPERDARVLVVVQLDGGNDGINTVVPYKDEGYARHRKALRLRPDQLIKVGDGIGLHPAMKDAGALLESGRLAIVQGVGYPNPNRSHFESMAIWHAGRPGEQGHKGPGWLGQALSSTSPREGGVPSMLYVGSGPTPVALWGRASASAALDRADDFDLDPAIRPGPEAHGRPAGRRPGRVRPPQHAGRLYVGRPDGRTHPRSQPRRPATPRRPWPAGSGWSPGC